MYSVADFVIRVKNASYAHRKEVIMPYSKIVKAIAKLLVREGFLADVRDSDFDGKKAVTVGIRYVRRKPVVNEIEILSKPSLRLHFNSNELRNEQRKKTSTIVVSTSQGLMTAKDALKKGLGGEVLFRIG
ncbi:MAG: 30S ribosomal protein S8 [Candidatus Levybacteria bacterium]|nr:30S ribosomal protein S8 [Candidatus Levybacteria bacterium]